jgi:peptidyl-prolyl cis-trans isomerase C
VTNWTIARLVFSAAVMVPTLASCDSKPSGQVVAVVNGEEITLQELNTELKELRSMPLGDRQSIRQQVLQQIIDRRLIAQTAKEEGMDRDPTFVIRERRMRDDLLVQMYGTKAAGGLRMPDNAAVTKYMQENPGIFAERATYTVDQIAFDIPADQSVLKKLEADKTMADVERTLAAQKISYQKGNNNIDSINVPTTMLKQILSLPAGEPFMIPAEGKILVSVITGKKPVPVAEKDAAPVAAQAMRAENLGKMLRQRLDEAKAKATITYQDGFAPPAKKAASK